MSSRRAMPCVLTVVMLLGAAAVTSVPSVTASAVGAAAAGVGVAQDVPQPQDPAQAQAAAEAERLLRSDAGDPVLVSSGDDGLADLVGTLGEPVPAPGLPAGAPPVRAATAHLDRYGALFAVDRPRAELDATEVVDTFGGSHVVKFSQQVDGLPVVGGELAVSVDAAGALESVNGETTDPDVEVPAPVESAAAAVRTARLTTARAHGVPRATLVAAAAERWFYDPRLIGSPSPLGPRPVWRVQVGNGADVDQVVLVDTATGRVVESVNEAPHAADTHDSVVCERAAFEATDRPCLRSRYVRTTATAASDDPEVEQAFRFAGDTWALYRALGRDLTALAGHDAGDGRKVRLTVRLPGENAFWNGQEAFFSTGFAVDDIVAHELTHGVIERVSGLAYWYQSGAINESMADVFGELVDQRNNADGAAETDPWMLGEDSSVGAIRDMQAPPSLVMQGVPRQPDRMRSRFYLADTLLHDNGGVHINSGVGNKAAFLIAQGGSFNGRTVRGLDAGRPDRRETARIFFRALQMLTSGSDYADLGRVLPQACLRLVGPQITENDCVQVRKAVAATEMLHQPRRATAPEAPRCSPRGAASRRLFFDNLERPARRVWQFGRLWQRFPNARVGAPFEAYATSGRRSLVGLDPDPRLGTAAKGSVTLRRAVRVPQRGRTFLRFDHARLFEYNGRLGPAARYYDGGRVEYSLDGGRRWADTAGLRWVNGPEQRIRAGGGFRGFGGDSHGYMSSRLDLTRFAGRTVRLRWTVVGDRAVSFLGWWLDDVEAYTCRSR